MSGFDFKTRKRKIAGAILLAVVVLLAVIFALPILGTGNPTQQVSGGQGGVAGWFAERFPQQGGPQLTHGGG